MGYSIAVANIKWQIANHLAGDGLARAVRLRTVWSEFGQEAQNPPQMHGDTENSGILLGCFSDIRGREAGQDDPGLKSLGRPDRQ